MSFDLRPYSFSGRQSSSLCWMVDGRTECCYDTDGRSVLFAVLQTAFQAPGLRIYNRSISKLQQTFGVEWFT